MTSRDVLTPTLRAVAAHGLAGAQVSWPEEPLDEARWSTLRIHVHQQRLEGLIAAAVADGSLPVTDAQAEQAHDDHVDRMCSVLVLEAELLHLSGLLLDGGVDLRLLKGSAVAHLDYPDPSLRCFGDVDLLVRGSQFDEAVALLTAAGLKRRFPQPRQGFDARFSKGTSFTTPDGIELDLHRTFVMGPFGLTIDLDDLWADSAPVQLGGAVLPALGTETRFLHACFHSALGDKVPRLVPQRDVAQMLLSGRLDVEVTKSLMTAWNARPVVARAISLAWTTLAIADVLALSAWAQRFSYDERTLRDFAAYLDDDADYAGKSLAAVRAIPGVRGKLAFTRALAFPSREYLQGRSRGVARLRRVIKKRPHR